MNILSVKILEQKTEIFDVKLNNMLSESQKAIVRALLEAGKT